ncbi:MAG: hypothetical protein NC335_07660 [Bacteroides sp.]|nr:hypothetical protein [Bacteroides sp.]
MKPIRLLMLWGFIVVSASCSVQRSLTSTAKVAHIRPEIIAMPTVVEFDVSETPVMADTVVTRNMFKKDVGFSNKKTVTDALIASVLKGVDADVLMEPKVNTEIVSKGFNSTLRVELSGYPAKYGRFRTVTKDDVDVLNALKKENSIACISMSKFLRTDVGKLYKNSEPYTNISDGNGGEAVVKNVEKVRWRRKTGYKGIYEFGYNMYIDPYYGIDEDSGFDATMYAHVSQGALLNPYLFLGGCTGFDVLSDRWNDFGIPLLAHMRVYMTSRKFAPYFDLKFGGSTMFYSGEYDGICGNFQTGLGFSVGAFSFGANYNLGFDAEDIAWNALKFNIAFSF